MTDFGVVTGLAFEARLIEKAFAREARAAPALACSGPGSERAQAAAAKLLAAGARVLVSFGLCAGLDPALEAGDLMLAADGVSLTGSDAPLRALHEALENAEVGQPLRLDLVRDGGVITLAVVPQEPGA
ncbi:MAG: hypothetical protein IH786_04960, partial [Proteobacteria bacterium]|nr:hypothetical protein [Pseudomonadota bacterium]